MNNYHYKFNILYKFMHIISKLGFLLLIMFLVSCQTAKYVTNSPNVAQAEVLMIADKSEEHHVSQMQVRQPKWMAVVERGDRATKAKKWGKAVQFYNRALDLIDHPIATPQAPSATEINKVLRLASQTQLLADNSREQGTRSMLDCGTMMRSQVRGIQIVKHLIPVQFEFSKAIFSEKGQESARQLAYCLRHTKGLSDVRLIGHTDDKGYEQYNYKLSVARAEALKAYLKTEGIMINITTDGKGKQEPLQLENPYYYTSAEIDALNRRVEVITQ